MVKKYLSGAKWVLKNSNYEYDGKLDANGSTDLKNIPHGTYDFTVSKKGYVPKTIQVTFGENPTSIDIDLEKEPKSEPEPEKPAKKTTSKKATAKKDEEKPVEKKTTTAKKTATKKSSSKKQEKADKK